MSIRLRELATSMKDFTWTIEMYDAERDQNMYNTIQSDCQWYNYSEKKVPQNAHRKSIQRPPQTQEAKKDE